MATEYDKQKAQALVESGRAKFAAKDFAGAVALLEEALVLDPNNETARHNLRWVRFNLLIEDEEDSGGRPPGN